MSSKSKKLPSQWQQKLLSIILPETERDSLTGDFFEIYCNDLERYTPLKAHLRLFLQIIRSIPRFIAHSILWSIIMFKNYLKIALRNLKKRKVYSFINITGLSMGMACCILILLWIQDELSYDRFHENKGTIYRVMSYGTRYFTSGIDGTPKPLAQAIKEEMPEIKNFARFAGVPQLVFKYEDKVFYESGGVIADPSIFEMFTFPFLKGDPSTALTAPNEVVISEDIAYKYFGYENPLDKTIEIEGKLATVKGVMKNMPRNSHFKFDFVFSFEFIDELSGFSTTWGSFNFVTYLHLQENSDPIIVGKKMTDIALKNECPQVMDGVYFSLQPLMEIHLDPRGGYRDYADVGDYSLVYAFSIIALFILLIACVNFMNLSTARSVFRAKEVGMRKTVGARRIQIMRQFFGESILLALIAGILALVIIAMFLPQFNNLSNKQLFLDFSKISHCAIFLSVILVTGVTAGLYPALFLSGFRPVLVLKGVDKIKGKGTTFRKVLVVFQFSLSILLIFGTTVLYKQLHFIRTLNLGFDKENVIYFPIKENIGEKYTLVKELLLKNSAILSVTYENYSYAEITNRAASNYD